MKLIIQGQALSLEGDDGQIVKLPEGTIAKFDNIQIVGRSPTRVGFNLHLRLDPGDIVQRPENAVDAKRTSIALGEGRGTHHTEYLLVFQAPPFDVNHAVRPRLEGWSCTGGIQIRGELEPAIPFVWVFRRTVEGPPPEPIAKLTSEDRKRLFSGIWTPESKGDLCFDLNLAFSPCEIRESP